MFRPLASSAAGYNLLILSEDDDYDTDIECDSKCLAICKVIYLSYILQCYVYVLCIYAVLCSLQACKLRICVM